MISPFRCGATPRRCGATCRSRAADVVKLVFLGRFREIANPALSEVALPGHVRTLAGLKEWLAEAEPALGQALDNARTQIAVNHAIVRDPAHPIAANDEIAFLPPMSGG